MKIIACCIVVVLKVHLNCLLCFLKMVVVHCYSRYFIKSTYNKVSLITGTIPGTIARWNLRRYTSSNMQSTKNILHILWKVVVCKACRRCRCCRNRTRTLGDVAGSLCTYWWWGSTTGTLAIAWWAV